MAGNLKGLSRFKSYM
uniref:Uncharacterized protein n=1 Tax=Arundo donax TaxID=35708 RepID=A0A0A9BWG3_ARUDO